ncbi:hypothetical protein [Virgisporangium aurantiacum]|nr:hypothetical protein [Virgisporangium aurantiacum]
MTATYAGERSVDAGRHAAQRIVAIARRHATNHFVGVRAGNG